MGPGPAKIVGDGWVTLVCGDDIELSLIGIPSHARWRTDLEDIRMALSRTARLGLSITFLLTAGANLHAQVTTTPKVAAKKEAAKEKVDLNGATLAELEALPGVGKVTAEKIIANRPYRGVEDLTKHGISQAEVDKLRPLVIARESAAEKVEKAKAEMKNEFKKIEAGEKVDVNKATAAELEALPGVGPAIAKAIMADRPYKTVDDLEKVKGLSKAKLAALKDLITSGPPAAVPAAPKAAAPKGGAMEKAKEKGKAKAAPKVVLAPDEKVNINKATAEELDVLPGIGPARAKLIVDARPFDKIEDIMKIKGIKEVEFGKIKGMITVK